MARVVGWPLPRALVSAIAPVALAGLYGGLSRLSLDLPAAAAASLFHGALVLHGVFGTLIPLERAVALRESWAYVAPLASLAGSVLLLLGLPAAGVALYGLGAFWFVAVSVRIVALQVAPFTIALLLGALSLAAGDALLVAGWAVSEIVALWLGFLVLTVAAERLELSRLLCRSPATVELFFLPAAAITLGAAMGGAESALFGAGLAGMALWMLRFDIAIRTIRAHGQVRFFAAAMLSGHLWLFVAGLAVLGGGWLVNPYDITIHAIGVGFALSMVFGHVLIILPAVAGIRLAYSTWLYLPLSLLQIGVVLRVLGAASGMDEVRTGSAYLTLIALVAFAGFLIANRPKRTFATSGTTRPSE